MVELAENPSESAHVKSAHVKSAHVKSAHVKSAHVKSAHVKSAHEMRNKSVPNHLTIFYSATDVV